MAIAHGRCYVKGTKFMATIEYGSGALYILKPDGGYEPLGAVNDIEIHPEEMYTDDDSCFIFYSNRTTECTASLSRDAFMFLSIS